MVLVCHKHPFIFLKTRKTAGSAIEMALEPLCVPPGQEITVGRKAQHSEYGIVGRRGGRMRYRNWRSAIRPIEWRHHQSAAFVRRAIGQEEWDRRAKITAVRNPFDRMVSHFLFETYRRKPHNPDFDALREEFKSFLKSRRCLDDHEIVHLDGRFIIDHAIRTESARADLCRVADALSLPFKDEWLTRVNDHGKLRKGRQPYEYYDAETIEIVRRRQAWVFDNYDYPEMPVPADSEPAHEVMT